MDQEDILKVVTELSSDEQGVRNWRRIYDALLLPPAEIIELTRSSGTTNYELFRRIVDSWIGSNGKFATIEKLCSVLRNLDLVHLADSLETKLADGRKSNLNFPLKHNYDGVVASYVPRPELENEIIQALHQPTEPHFRIDFPTVVLYGIGGNGKTTLARRIVKICEKRGHFGSSSIWINAEHEANIINEYLALLSINGRGKKTPIMLKEKLFNSTLKNKSCLLVFDNVDNLNKILTYLPLNLKTKISLLITSNQEWNCCDYGSPVNIPIDRFTLDEFSTFVTKIIKHVSPDEIEILENYTGRYPYLANIVCHGFIPWSKLHEKKTLSQYLELTDENILNGRQPRRTTFVYERTPQQIIERQMKCIQDNFDEGPLAWEILTILAYCYPDLLKSELTKCLGRFSTKFEDFNGLESGLKLLVEQGILETHPFSLSIHRSHQHAIRLILNQNGCALEAIKGIVQNWGFLTERVFNLPLIWSLIKGYEDLGLGLIADNATFLAWLFEDGGNNELAIISNYVKSSRAQKDYMGWLLNQKSELCPLSGALVNENSNLVHTFVAELKQFVRKNKSEKNWIDETLTECLSSDFVLSSPQFNAHIVFEAFPHLLHSKIQGNATSFLAKAVESMNLPFVQYLIGKEMDCDEKDEFGRSLLHKAISSLNLEIVEELLDGGANPNIQDFAGDTPLHIIAGESFGSREIVDLLLSKGANVNIQNKIGETPLEIFKDGSLEVISYNEFTLTE